MGGKQWTTEHFNDKDFYLSTDDDVTLKLGDIVDLIKGWMYGKEKNNWPEFPIFCLCGAALNIGPIRDIKSKYYISKETYKSTRYPVFCFGPGLVTSISVARQLLEESRKYDTAEIHLEDVWITGILRTRVGMPDSIIRNLPKNFALHQFGYAKVKDRVLFAKEQSNKLWDDLKYKSTCKCNDYVV